MYYSISKDIFSSKCIVSNVFYLFTEKGIKVIDLRFSACMTHISDIATVHLEIDVWGIISNSSRILTRG